MGVGGGGDEVLVGHRGVMAAAERAPAAASNGWKLRQVQIVRKYSVRYEIGGVSKIRKKTVKLLLLLHRMFIFLPHLRRIRSSTIN